MLRPKARYETERLSLDAWERHGFDVFKRLDLPLPARFDPPGVWFEYCHGQPLSSLVEDSEVDLETKLSLMHRLGESLCRRPSSGPRPVRTSCWSRTMPPWTTSLSRGIV